jgi:hypothetical protein
MFILSLLLGISIAINIILFWYTRKLIQNLYYGVKNVDELQKLLNEYASLLEPITTMENYYGDPVISSAVANTKLVVEACKGYKNSIIESENEEEKENIKKENIEKEDKKEQRQTKATISSF